MACPKCECKVHYEFDDSWDGFNPTPDLERCANCNYVFHIDDALDDCEGLELEPNPQNKER